MMRLVILESPYSGDVDTNVLYAHSCIYDCLTRDESAIASHLVFPHVLDDGDPDERRLGIEAGLAWIRVADATVVYTDLGISPGMKLGIARAEAFNVDVVYRQIGPDWRDRLRR